MNPASSIPSSCKFGNFMVDQTPRYDNKRTVVSRKTGIRRSDKRKKKPKFF